jgi:hypothetical protein
MGRDQQTSQPAASMNVAILLLCTPDMEWILPEARNRTNATKAPGQNNRKLKALNHRQLIN